MLATQAPPHIFYFFFFFDFLGVLVFKDRNLPSVYSVMHPRNNVICG